MQENHLSNQAHDKDRQRSERADSQHSQQSQAHTFPQQYHGETPELELQQTVEKLQTELATANDRYIRLYAEFENFRKRTLQERLSLIETAGEKLLQQFLPILDDFERALMALRQENISLVAVEEGITLIYDKMIRFLEQADVKAMSLEKGSTFNAEFHEAITKTPVTDPALHNKVIDVVEKGYMLKGKVLRYAKVIIGA